MNQYDNPEFIAEYAKMSRGRYGLEGAATVLGFDQSSRMIEEAGGSHAPGTVAGADAGRNEASHDAPGKSKKSIM